MTLPGVGADVLDAANGRTVGQLRGAVVMPYGTTASQLLKAVGPGAAWGIAFLKLEAALPGLADEVEFIVRAPVGDAADAVASREQQGLAAASGGMSWRVIPVRPTWWPSEWGCEEELARAGVRAV